MSPPEPETQARQAEVFLQQAESCQGRSPLYAGLCQKLATDPRVGEIVPDPIRDSPLRLLGGLNYLVLSGQASWSDVDLVLDECRDFLRDFVARYRVQTNEVQRCWMLLPCFLEVARRSGAEVLDAIELGSSAGLNLNWHRYQYQYHAGNWGPPNAALWLQGEERRPVPGPLLQIVPEVRSTIGIDIAPIDPGSSEGVLRLRSFVWPDQRWRLEQLDRAITVGRAANTKVIEGDIAEVLPGLLQRRASDSLTLVWQSAALSYLPAPRQELVHRTLAEAGKAAPLAFVETAAPADGEPDCYGLTAQIWPGGERWELAHADYHGAWIDWLA